MGHCIIWVLQIKWNFDGNGNLSDFFWWLQWYGFYYVGLHCICLPESRVSGDPYVWRLVQSHYWVYLPTYIFDYLMLCYMLLLSSTIEDLIGFQVELKLHYIFINHGLSLRLMFFVMFYTFISRVFVFLLLTDIRNFFYLLFY